MSDAPGGSVASIVVTRPFLSRRRQWVSVCVVVARLPSTTLSSPSSAPAGLINARSM